MIRRLCLIGALVWLGIGPASASAQSSPFLVLFGNGAAGPPVSTTNIPGRITGSLTISFRGDPATGCAQHGVCAYRGTVLVRPGSGSEIAVAKYRGGGHSYRQTQLTLVGGPFGAETAAEVKGPDGGTCADAQQPFLDIQATIEHGVATLPLLQPGGDLLATRCAGPLDGDLAGLGPKVKLPLAKLLRGRTAVDLRGSWSFAAGGFAGRLDSTLELSLGRPATPGGPSLPRRIRTRRDRELTETLTLTRGQGDVDLSVTGDPSTCQFLDSCGNSGSLNGAVSPHGAAGSLTVVGPATRPYRDFLAALRLSRHGDPRGLDVTGSLDWTSGGTAASDLGRGTPCTSQAPLGGGSVEFSERGGRLLGAYGLPAPMRTRCPGPTLSEAQVLASGGVELGQLGRRSFTLRLGGAGHLTQDGYVVAQRTSVSLTLRRGHVRQQMLAVPAG